MPSSTRRYQSLPDVRSEKGRREVDAQPATGQRFYTPGSPYERYTAIPPRRTATQSSLPAVNGNHDRERNTLDENDRDHNGCSKGGQEKKLSAVKCALLAVLDM